MKKICSKCKVSKSIDDFHKNYKNKSGVTSICKSCHKKSCRNNYLKNAESIKEKALIRYEMKKEEIQSANRARFAKFQEKYKATMKIWRINNLEKINALSAKRKATKRKATPSWANIDAIEIFYKKAKELEIQSGEKYNVDHIVPLHGKNVSGLHCEFNLQVITAMENMKKHNNFSADTIN